MRGVTRGVFECDQCGDFPDYRSSFQEDLQGRTRALGPRD